MSKYLGLNISDELDDAITARVAITQETKTKLVTTALTKELGVKNDSSILQRVNVLEQEVIKIKEKLVHE